MKTYSPLTFLFIVMCLHFNVYAQVNQIAINSYKSASSTQLIKESHNETPVTILNYCFTDATISQASSIDLGIDSSTYVVGIVNMCEANESCTSCDEDIFSRTFKKGSTWFFEMKKADDKDMKTDDLKHYCIKLLVYNKRFKNGIISESNKLSGSASGLEFSMPELY